MVALTPDPRSVEPTFARCPISLEAVHELLEVRPELTIDGKRPDVPALAQRLAASWCPDEVVLYIGLAGTRGRITVSELSDRVSEYYKTPLGARSPHAGGWPLKTLMNLDSLFVHYCYCEDVAIAENSLLDAFSSALSPKARSDLHDPLRPIPFANLRSKLGNKALGIKGARALREGRDHKGGRAAVIPPPPLDDGAGRAGKKPSSARWRTQRITAADIGRGSIRIPRWAKEPFPRDASNVEINIKGTTKSCRWNPRYGPDQDRPGVLGIGRALMQDLLTEGEALGITQEGEILYLA